MVLVGVFLLWGFYSIYQLIVIKTKGSQVIAQILKVDTNCDKYNKIVVNYGDKVYEVAISRTDCREGVYKVGQNVTLIKFKDYDTLVWPSAQYEWLPFLFLFLLALVYYTNKDKFIKSKQQ
jgi:regulator of sigma D